MNPQMRWWLDHTSQGRRTQRRMMPESALMPRARAEARAEREEQERRMTYVFARNVPLAAAAARKLGLDRDQWRHVCRPQEFFGITADQVVLVEPFKFDNMTQRAYDVLCRRPGKLRVVNLDARQEGSQ